MYYRTRPDGRLPVKFYAGRSSANSRRIWRGKFKDSLPSRLRIYEPKQRPNPKKQQPLLIRGLLRGVSPYLPGWRF